MAEEWDGFEGLLAGLSDEDFEHWFGSLARLNPAEAATLFEGIDAPWWIVGGWAIEAFNRHSRQHEDVDVSILATDVPAMIAHFLGTHHLWAAGSGMMSPLLSVDQPLPSWSGQVWIRESAKQPWLLDVIVAPSVGRRWRFRRDPEVVMDLEQTIWLAEDGLRYQNPEIILAFKAKEARPKDQSDLELTLPLLEPSAKNWLEQTISRLYPDHAWMSLLQS